MRFHRLLILLLIAATLWAYHNSLIGPFILDDHPYIRDNPRIRRLWPIWDAMRPPPHSATAGPARPIATVSLAINYALGGLNPAGYHATNLLIHLLAVLTLYGIARRTLGSPRLRNRFGPSATGLAGTIALLWAVHPLQTQAVTYLIQRSESLMGLCYLLTVYAVIRSAASPVPRRWHAAAIASCALGMGTKPVMVTAPIVVFLYDAIFLAGSAASAWRTRRGLHAGLALTWGILAALWAALPKVPMASAGFGIEAFTPLQYLATQMGVLTHYLRLAVWPHPLVFDYAWPRAAGFGAVALPALGIVALLVATGWTLLRKPALGFLGAWFFLILSVTSSVLPIADAAFEHRMYLPLASVIALLVLAGYRWLPRGLAMGLVPALAVAAGTLTIRRNADYASELAIWQDTAAKRPDNPRAHCNLGVLLAQEDRFEEALAHYAAALRLKSAYPEVHNNICQVRFKQGRLEEAEAACREAVRLRPYFVDPHINLGIVLVQQGRLDEALTHYEEAVRLMPERADAHANLGKVLFQRGVFEQAIAHFLAALAARPEDADTHSDLGAALAHQQRLDEAIAHLTEALRLKPDSAEAHHNLGTIFAQRGRFQEAAEQFAQALQRHPRVAETRYRLGLVLAAMERWDDAVSHYTEAVQLQPEVAEVRNDLGVALAQLGRLEEAASHFAEAVRLKPAYPEAHNNLGNVLLQRGEVEQAIAHYEEALRLKPDFSQAQQNLQAALAQRRQGEPAP